MKPVGGVGKNSKKTVVKKRKQTPNKIGDAKPAAYGLGSKSNGFSVRFLNLKEKYIKKMMSSSGAKVGYSIEEAILEKGSLVFELGAEDESDESIAADFKTSLEKCLQDAGVSDYKFLVGCEKGENYTKVYIDYTHRNSVDITAVLGAFGEAVLKQSRAEK